MIMNGVIQTVVLILSRKWHNNHLKHRVGAGVKPAPKSLLR